MCSVYTCTGEAGVAGVVKRGYRRKSSQIEARSVDSIRDARVLRSRPVKCNAQSFNQNAQNTNTSQTRFVIDLSPNISQG